MSVIENKPIALVTGAPGSGKTALIVNFIREAAAQGRPIYQVGIPELQVSHIPPPKSMDDWTEIRPDPDVEGANLPYFTFPERSLVVLSEAQRYYRPRAAASRVPDYVAAFETCRHTGVTFILDTQHPDFIDSHIRKLIGQHIHLLDHGVLGRKHYEWPYLGNPEQFKTAPIKKPFKLPKEVFHLYKSSSLHIQRNYTFPPALKFLIGLGVVILVGGFFVGGRIIDKVHPADGLAKLDKPSTVSPGQSSDATKAASLEPAALLMAATPRVTGRPETAPLYDTLRVAKVMPVVVGCVQTPSKCTCQNQQGTDSGLDDAQCRAWLKNPPFDPYREQTATRKEAPTQTAVRPAESVQSSGGSGSQEVENGELSKPSSKKTV